MFEIHIKTAQKYIFYSILQIDGKKPQFNPCKSDK